MTQRDEFDIAGNHVPMKDLIGELVLFSPTEYVEEMNTVHGVKDVVVADLVVLTADGGPIEHPSALVFQGPLIGLLKRKIHTGRKVLGVVSLGEAKNGKQAPYRLAAPTDEQQQMARDYLAGRTIEQATESAHADDDPFAVGN